ncbi:MAG: formate dehydrogenase subunit delta [Hyphomicrobiales bacterium]|jgi:formate dehydrogenase subunit delta
MELKDMVRMANQIASFYHGYPEAEASREIADHINRFWEPRMREELLDHLAQGGKGLAPVVVAAAAQIHKPDMAAA